MGSCFATPHHERSGNMNKVIRIDYDREEITETYAPMMVYITCQTDGEPNDLYWVWEVTAGELVYYFRNEPDVIDTIDNEDMYFEDVERFVNDEDILEDSDYYECGKEPIYGCWYAPLTMEQIERTFGL